jgi:DNA-binding LytR/AlgR family response regulator
LTAKNHYVEVVTDKGSTTIRMRLADAIDEMEPVEGYCVHRSHWVARSAINAVERENAQKIFVLLSNGDRIPVSRKYRPNLEKTGLVATPHKTLQSTGTG